MGMKYITSISHFRKNIVSTIHHDVDTYNSSFRSDQNEDPVGWCDVQ